MNTAELDTFKKFTAEMAEESAKLIMRYYASPDLIVEQKRDRTPVTAADKGVVVAGGRVTIGGETVGSRRFV